MFLRFKFLIYNRLIENKNFLEQCDILCLGV